MPFKDYFSKQSDIYVKARPGYPDELFKYLASLCNAHDTAWDCATGNGQAAVSLVSYFKKVIATDASEQQLKNATPCEGIIYRKALAEDSGIENESADLVTIANGLHWFVHDDFFKEVNRVLKRGGVLAAWTYAKSYVEGENKEEMKDIIERFSHETLRDYWPEESRYVMNGYKDIHLPFEAVDTPMFKYTTQVDLNKVLGFFYSWSSTQRYITQTGKDPVLLIKDDLLALWGGNGHEIKTMTWELSLKAGRKS